MKLYSVGSLTWNADSNASTQVTNVVPSDTNGTTSTASIAPADSAAIIGDWQVTPWDTNATVTVQASPGGNATRQGISSTAIVVSVIVLVAVVVVLVAAVLVENKRSSTAEFVRTDVRKSAT